MTFKNTLKQNEAIQLLKSEAKHNMLLGGSRSGKTFIASKAIAIRASKVKSRHAIFRDKFNHIKTSVWMDTFPKMMGLCFPNVPYHANKTDYYITLPNGSEIWFCGLDDGKRVEKVLGKEFSTLYFNETSQIQYSSVTMALTRLAEKNSLKKKAYYDENPPDKTHWSYWQFIKKLHPIDNIPLIDPNNYGSLLMNPMDNLDNIDSEYISILDEMPERDRNRFKYGIFNESNDGVAYHSFSRERHVSSGLKRIDGTLFIGMDFNVNPMTAAICQVINGKLHVLDEAYLENSDTYKMANHLKNKNQIGTVLPDSTGGNRKTSGRTDFQILQEANFTIQSTYNPYVNDRVNNLNRLFYNDMIIIDDKCKKLINDLEKTGWKNGELDEGKDKMLTHISDALGYAAWKLFPMDRKLSQTTIGRSN